MLHSNITEVQSVCTSLINECIASDDVNRRQVIYMELKDLLMKSECAAYRIFLIKQFEKLEKHSETTNTMRVFSMLAYLHRYKKDIISALPYIDRATEMGDANCMFLKGYIYHKGIDVPVNRLIALEYYHRAKKLNHRDATFNFGVLYSECFDNRGNLKPDIADNQHCLFTKYSKLNGSDYVLKQFFKAANLGSEKAIVAFNKTKKNSWLMQYSFYSSPVVWPAVNQDHITQEIKFMAVSGLGIGEGSSPFCDSYTVKHILQLPAIFSTLSKQVQDTFLNQLLVPNLQNIYVQHTEKFQTTFDNSPFEAEKDKINFSEKTRHELIQTETDRMSKEYLVGNAQEISDKIERAVHEITEKRLERKSHGKR